MDAAFDVRFTISPGIGRVIEAYDNGRLDELVPEMGEVAVHLLRTWWPLGRMTAVRFTGDIWGPADEATILAQAEKADLGKGTNVLDIACGIGGPGRILARHYGCKVTGVDIDAGTIEVATGLARLEGLTDLVSYQLADKALLPFPDNAFDVVWGRGGWGPADASRDTWREALRVVRSGGQVLATSGADLLPFLTGMGFAEVTFFSYYREERRRNLRKFLRALEVNQDEIITRTGQKNYDEWYQQKSEQLAQALRPDFSAGVLLALK